MWETLKVDDKYEISNEYPYQIRKKDNGYVVKISKAYNGYMNVCLSGKTYGMHKVVAIQWIDNPNNYTEVNHKDAEHRDNYNKDNLEWTTHSDNLRLRASYVRQPFNFIDALPQDAAPLNEYKSYTYDKYWFDYSCDKLIILSRGRYRYVNISDNHGRPQVSLVDVNGKQHSVFWNKFIKVMHDRKEQQ